MGLKLDEEMELQCWDGKWGGEWIDAEESEGEMG